MGHNSGLIKRIDELIFKQVDELKNHPQLQSVLTQLDALPDTRQKIIIHSLSYFFVLLPFLIIVVVFAGNYSLKSEIDLKEKILLEMGENGQKQSQLNTIGRNVLGATPLTSKSDLERTLNNIARRYQVAGNNINVKKFESFSTGGNLNKTEATIVFEGLSTKNLTDFMRDLLSREKIKVADMRVSKDVKKSTLTGELQIVHFGKQLAEQTGQ